MSVQDILRLPLAQGLQLRSVGLMKQNVDMKPRGGSKLRRQVEDILGDNLPEWCE